ncbi:MAG: hypothetical protein AB7P04_05355 [Bacteriovoracia bacterium]
MEPIPSFFRLQVLVAGLSVASASGIPEATTPPDRASMEQTNQAGDAELRRILRQEIIEDEALSGYAKNVSVITSSGSVVLARRGSERPRERPFGVPGPEERRGRECGE